VSGDSRIGEGTVIKAIRKFLRALGIDIVRFPGQEQARFSDFSDAETNIIDAVRPWTMTSAERIHALIQGVRYVSINAIEGAVVECGVWKGGSMAAAARALVQLQDVKRDLYLFDTYEGMSEPTSSDIDHAGRKAVNLMKETPDWCAAALEDVKEVLYNTGYPRAKIHFVRGKVEETVPACAPDSISLLRLDTDWYESTKHELVHLFPRLSERGVIIIDDYGYWRGSRQACDEYFAQNRIPILLNRIDNTGRIALKV
jgi:O-methyltransferase